jgi:hypothetical protein
LRGGRGQVDVAVDGPEQVVEVVGDAARQDAERLQLVDLVQLLLEPAVVLFGLSAAR